MQKTKFKFPKAGQAVSASLVLLTTFALTACAPGHSAQSPIASSIDASLGCKNFEDALWKSLNQSIEQNGRPPLASDVEAALGGHLKQSLRFSKVSTETRSKISSLTADIAATIALRTEKGPADAAGSASGAAKTGAIDEDQERGLWLERVAQLEIGDRTTDEKSHDVDMVQAKIAQLKAIADQEGLSSSCVAPPTDSTPGTTAGAPMDFAAASILAGWKDRYAAPVYGGLKAFATMYQSCDAATRAPLGSDVNVRGIGVTGKHSSGDGNKRVIVDKRAFLASHPYVGNGVYHRPLPSCQDVQAAPSIYDYGGKPYTSSADDKLMNFFKNAGTGSRELGIDCSGLVYSAYATAGLKFKKGTLKASLVNGVSSTMLTQPQQNGLTCLDHATFRGRSSLLAGDIIAIAGHVIMVADIGNDPFGIDGIDSVAKCTLGNMSISRFNFTIFQSSPSKGGIGVNRMKAREYLTSGSTMGRGMLAHAVNACKAKFQSAAIVSKSSSASVVRHLGTSECTDPVPVKLTQEECLSSCSAQSLD